MSGRRFHRGTDPPILSDMEDGQEDGALLRAQLAALEEQCRALKRRIERLERPAARPSTPISPDEVTAASPSAEKVNLFRKPFSGRTDVFSVRWENSGTGRSGYAPACRNEWVRGEPAVVPIFGDRVLGVPDHAGSCGFVVVAPLEAADLGLSTRRGNREIHNGLHGDLRTAVTPREALAQSGELVGGGSPRAPLGLGDPPQLAAGSLGLGDDLGVYRKLPDALGGPQDDADPDQVIDHRRRPGASRTARLDVADQLGRILERHFPMPGPAQGSGAVGKGPAFPVQDLVLAAQADDGCVAGGTVRLLAYFDRRHCRQSGET